MADVVKENEKDCNIGVQLAKAHFLSAIILLLTQIHSKMIEILRNFTRYRMWQVVEIKW